MESHSKTMSFTPQLTTYQRRLADSLTISICRGNYSKALQVLNNGTRTLPTAQENSLRHLLERLRRKKKMDSRLACEKLMKELQLPDLDNNVIINMNTHIPRGILSRIYEQLFNQSFTQFYVQLEHIQWVEHTIIEHTLILYDHCIKLKSAQLAIDELQDISGRRFELYVLYAFLLPIGIYLASFFF